MKNMGASRKRDRAGRATAQAPAGLDQKAAIPCAWAQRLADSAIELIREVGIYGLGGNDGCPCTNFSVRNINVDVSCHKSEMTVRVYTHHADYTDEDYRTDTRLLEPIAQEVLRQVDAYYDAGGEYAADFTVRYCSWEEDRPSAIGKLDA